MHWRPLYTITPCPKNLPNAQSMHLVSGGTAGLGDDTLELIDLGLGTAERTETLLCQLTGTLVLAVAEEFDNAALVWGEARRKKTVRICPFEVSMEGGGAGRHTQKPP